MKPGTRVLIARIGQRTMPPPVPTELPGELRFAGNLIEHIEDLRRSADRLRQDISSCRDRARRVQNRADRMENLPGESEANLEAHDARARCETLEIKLLWVLDRIRSIEESLTYTLSIPQAEEPEAPAEIPPLEAPPVGPPRPGMFAPLEPESATPTVSRVETETRTEPLPVATAPRFDLLRRLLPVAGAFPGTTAFPSLGQRGLPPAPPPVPEDLASEIQARQAVEDAIGAATAEAETNASHAQKWCDEAAGSRRRAEELEASGDPGLAEENLKAQDAQNRCDRWRAELDASLRRLTQLMEYQQRQLAPTEEEEPEPVETPSRPPTGPHGTPRIVVPPRPPRALPMVTTTAQAPSATLPVAGAECPPDQVMTAQGCVPEGAGVVTQSRFPGLQRLLPLVGGGGGGIQAPTMGQTGGTAGYRQLLRRYIQNCEYYRGLAVADPDFKPAADWYCDLAAQAQAALTRFTRTLEREVMTPTEAPQAPRPPLRPTGRAPVPTAPVAPAGPPSIPPAETAAAPMATSSRFPWLQRLLPLVGGLPGGAVPFASMGRRLGQAAPGLPDLLRERDRLAALARQAVDAAAGLGPGDPVTAQTLCSIATQIDAVNRDIRRRA